MATIFKIHSPYFDFFGLPITMFIEADKDGCDFLKQHKKYVIQMPFQ